MSVTMKDPPDPHDVTDFRFQGLRKVRLSEPLSLTSSTVSLVTVVPKAGLVLVAGDRCLHVVKTMDIEKQDQCSKAERASENSQLSKMTLDLPGEVLSVGVSCDGLTTSVVVKVGQFPTCLLFDTRGLITSPADLPLSSTSLNTTSSSVLMTGLTWNPALPDMFCVTWEDGSLALYTVKGDGNTDCLTLPPAAGVVAMAWSPKGKQLVAVKKNKDLVQYKPDLSVAKYPALKEMKTIPGPAQDGLVPVSVAWLSTYEFLVGLRDYSDREARPGLWLVKGSKVGDVEHTPYDDICYSTGDGVGMVFTSHTLQEWGVVVVGSSASIELGVLGTDAGVYTQWILEDNARAEIPLDSGNEECYPTGLAVDYTSTVGTPVGETTGPPSPLLYLLSSDGLLCPFYCVNTKQGAPPLCSPPAPLPEGKRAGTIPLPTPAKQPTPPPTIISSIPPKPAANLTNIFNLSANTSFAQSTPLKPLPTSTSLFQPPPVTKDPTPPLLGLPIGKPAKDPSPPFGKIAKDPSPPFGKVAKDPSPPFGKLAKDPTPPFGKLAKDPSPPFGKLAKDPTPPLGNLAKDPTPPFLKDSTPPNYKPKEAHPHFSSLSKDPRIPSNIKLGSSKETTPLSDSTTAKVSAAIDEEYEAFEAELKELRNALGSMKTFIGTQQDKIELCTRTESCSKFCRDVIDTTQCQNTEIFSLRSSTLETFSWLEEAKARDSSTGDSRYMQLLRARPLDPRSLRRMEDLRGQFFYCEQQVEEVGNALDCQWEEHVGKLKRTVRGNQPSEREELSQAVMTNHKILERQSDVVDEITVKVKKLQAAYPITMGRPGRSPNTSRAESELDKLAESLREKSKLTPAKSGATSSSLLAQVSTPSPVKVSTSSIVSPVKALTPSTDQALRSMLNNRPLSITKAVRRDSTTCKSADQPSSAKMLEKLKASTPPVMQRIVASGSVAFTGLSSDKSAFQSVTASSKSKQVAFQPVSLPKQSSTYTSGSISVEISGSSASTKPVKAPVYEPISPASNSPEKNEEATPPSSSKSLAGLTSKESLPQKATTAKEKPKVTPDNKSPFGNLSSAVTSTSGDSSKTALSSALSSGSSASASSSLSSTSTFSASSGGGSIFGGLSSSATSSAPSSIDDVPSSLVPGVATSSSISVFGSKAASSSTASVFGNSANNKDISKPTGFNFGSGSTATPSLGLLATKVSDFGTSTTTSTSIFGGSTVASLGSVSKSATPSTGLDLSSSSAAIYSASSLLVSSTSASTTFGSKTTIDSASAFGGSGISAFGQTGSSSIIGSTGSGGIKLGSAFDSTSSSAASPSDSVTTSTSTFGAVSSSGSVFGAVSAKTSGSVFGVSSQPTSSSASVFGGAAQSASSDCVGTTTEQKSTGSVFSGTTKTISTGSVFGGTTQTTSTGTTVVASGGLTIGASTGSVFGGSSQPVAKGSIFGGSSSDVSVFGGSKPVSADSTFGGTTQPASTSESVFGGSKSAVSGSIFGGSTQPASSSASLSIKTPSTGSVFGGASQPTSSSVSVFGGSSQPASTGSVFGGTSQPTSTGSVFGGTSQPASSSGSVFGGSSQPTSAGSVFGGTSQPASSSGSVFGGSSQPTSTGSVFGGTSQPTSAGSVFGGTSQPASSSGSVFGGSSQPTSAGSVFGGTSQPASSSGSVFGGTTQPTSTGSVFGGAAQPVASSGSVFGGGNTSGGGGFLGGLGGTASSDNAGKNPFGGASSTFGASSSGGMFGGSGSSSAFGGTSQSQASTFGSPSAFSSGSNIASQGFGVQQNTPSKPTSAFGGAPAFGSPPALGAPPAFGSTAGFGAAPAFGGASSFGGGATFGSAAAAAPAFGAAANAPTFGSMAGSSAPAFGAMTNSAPAFGSSGGGFGGGAPSSPPPAGQQFNSWR